MKKLVFLFILVGSLIVVDAQIPAGLNYQAVVRNSSGDVVVNQTVKFKFSILQNSTTGTSVYVETQSATTNNFGLANLVIGKGSKLSGDLDPSGWGNNTHFLKVEIDPANGNSFKHLGTTQMMSVPYAFHAQTVEEGGAGDNWGTQAVESDETLVGSGTSTSPLKIAQQGAASGQVLKWSGSSWLPGDINGVANLWQQNGSDIYFNEGRVGIGTNSPDYDLDISKSSGNSHLMVKSATNGAYLTLDMEGSYASNYSFINFKKGGEQKFTVGLAYDEFRIFNKDAKGLLIESDGDLSVPLGGRLGIGVRNPVGSLCVNSGSSSTFGRYFNSESDQGPDQGLLIGISGMTGWLYNYENGPLQLGTNDMTVMTIDADSRVGIGTTTPNAALHVEDRIRVGEDPNYGTVYGELIHEGGGNGFKINANANGGWADLHLQTDGNTRMFIESVGNVGIGTNSPTQKLDVNGFVRIRELTPEGMVGVTGAVYHTSDGTLIHVASDVRLKENIEPLNNCLEKITQLQGVSFSWKADPNHNPRIGFIAQDFEKVIPELAFTYPDDGYMGINYAEITTVLTEAIKELKAENDKLKAANKQILDRLEKLENMVNATAQKTK